MSDAVSRRAFLAVASAAVIGFDPDRRSWAANEIYKAVGQNFSYVAILAGAILTFGKDALGPAAAGLLACVPLLI